jgi:Protein of unknown function, DUF547
MNHTSGRIYPTIILLALGVLVMLNQTANAQKSLDYFTYAQVLKQYVDDQGLVHYSELKKNRTALDQVAASLGAVTPETLSAWSTAEQLAFWINAYNAFTLQLIVDHYPIKAGFFSGLAYPKNSIRQIPGAWDKVEFVVAGKKETLDAIEHTILRAKFQEPRIHMALVCAALSCPKLRNEPYTGKKLNEQLDDQTRGFLSQAEKFQISVKDKSVKLSPIFKWFGKDFVSIYQTEGRFAKLSQAENAVLNFVFFYLDEAKQGKMDQIDLKVEYLNYDWTLNEQGGK